MVNVCLSLYYTAELFSKVHERFYIPSSNTKSFSCSVASLALDIILF